MKKIIFYVLFLLLTTLNLSAVTDIIDLDNVATQGEDFTIWIALFGLGAVGLIALFLSSERLKNFKSSVEKKEDTQNKMNQAQDQILSDMSENIQNIAKSTVATTKKLAINDNTSISGELTKVANSEVKLLAITTNLIEFLRIKSKKVKIVNEELNLSNLLNDVSGTLRANTKNIEFELIYDINSNIPDKFKGDTLNLSKIMVNLLLYCVDNSAKEIKLNVSRSNLFNKNENLYFTISSDIKFDIENNDNIFNSNYNEETNNYDSLGLFIARELSFLMGGELIVRNDRDGFIEFLFNIRFKNIAKEELNDKLENKKVFIVDSSKNSASVIKDIFINLKYKVKLESEENYLLNIPNFDEYDIVVINEKLFTKKVVEKLSKFNGKVIALSNLFKISTEFENTEIADLQLNKPLTRKQISDAIKQLYCKKEESIFKESVEINEDRLAVYREIFKDTPNINLNSFAEFRGTNVLIVEDNLINQKVLIGMLGKSGMNITVADNGKEALKVLDSAKVFNIVFMDINMPIMDGYTAAKKIREKSQFDQLPIIALSALTSISEVDRMFSSQMNGYLAKPLKKEKLFTAFALFVDKKSQDRRQSIREEKKVVSLDGLNIALGISQSSSNEIFYKEILSEFKDAYGDSSNIFEKLVIDFRYEQLKMLCIDVKGLSGSIGAEDMHELTTEILQRLLYKKYDIIPTFVEKYSQELNRINRSIDEYIG